MNNGIKLLHLFSIGLYQWRTILLLCEIYITSWFMNYRNHFTSYISKDTVLTVTSCFVCRDLKSINHLWINPISNRLYRFKFYLTIVNKTLRHYHSWLARQYIAAACVVLFWEDLNGQYYAALAKKSDSIYDKLWNKSYCFLFYFPNMSRDMWFPRKWQFDMNRLRRAYAASF